MGLFGPSIKYSQKEYQFPEVEIKRFLAHVRINSSGSFTNSEEEAVENAILARRRGDGAISLQQIYEVLSNLRNKNIITKVDFSSLMDDFKGYFVEHYKE